MKTTPFPISPTLTAIALGYQNKQFIADRIFIRAPVDSEEYRWNEYDLEHFRITDTLVGRKGTPNEVEFTAKEHTSFVKDHGLEDAIPMSDIKKAAKSKFNPVQRATMKLAEKIALAREKRVADALADVNNYGGNLALSGTDLFNDPASKPIITLNDAIESMYMRPNQLVANRSVLSALRTNPSIVKAFNGSTGDDGMVPIAFLADLLEIEIVQAEARYQMAKRTNADDDTAGLTRLFGNSVSLLYTDPTARPDDSITFGITAEFEGRIAGDWEDKNIGLRGGRRIRVGESLEEKVLAKDAGYLLQNVIG